MDQRYENKKKEELERIEDRISKYSVAIADPKKEKFHEKHKKTLAKLQQQKKDLKDINDEKELINFIHPYS